MKGLNIRYSGKILALILGLTSLGFTSETVNAEAGLNTFPTALQLWSVRKQFAEDGVDATLDMVQKWGVKEVELAGNNGLSPADFKAALEKRGLKAVSAHFGYDRFQKDPEGVAKEAKELGVKYAGCAWIPHDKKFTKENCEEAIKVFNRAGEVMAKNGITFFYHIHGFEFEASEDGNLFDTLVKGTNPEFVSFEMDVLWTYLPGIDPVELLKKYPDRWSLLHLKDLKKGHKRGLGVTTAPEDRVILGTGQVDWPAVLKAAKEVNVVHAFIEDESPDPVNHIPASIEYLESLR